MSISVDNDKQTRLALREKRQWDMVQAKKEHDAERVAVLSKTAHLRALRLAEEAKAPAVQKPKRRVKKTETA